MRKTYIYILIDPETQQVRYVGKTVNLKKRYNNHLFPDNNYYVSKWTRKLMSKGLRPILEVIDEVFEGWEFWEQHYISLFRSWGYKLTNLTLGGEGVLGKIPWNKGKKGVYSEESLEKMRNKDMKGSKNPCSKLTDTQVLEIRERVYKGEKQKYLAKEYGIACGTLNRIVLKKSYSHL